MSNNPLLRYLTDKELSLAAEYEALGDDPERRDAIRRELYNIRWKLDSEASRKYHSTGKGRRDAALNRDAVQMQTRHTSTKWLEEKAIALLNSPGYEDVRHTLPTLLAIIRNRSKRTFSIEELMQKNNCSFSWAEKKYYADRKLLQKYFSAMGGK